MLRGARRGGGESVRGVVVQYVRAAARQECYFKLKFRESGANRR